MKKVTLILVAIAILGTSTSVFSQGTAFTYQGRLSNGANPANGSYDLRFAIYDAPTAGTQQGGAVTNTATGVTNGLFTVTLDFGNQFPGANRWLEIAARTNGAGAFATLSPRQQISAAPYAVRALTAATAASMGASNITGTLSISQLPTNVALRTGGNTFSGNQTFDGGDLYMDYNHVLFAKNQSGQYDFVFAPRIYNDATGLFFGAGGLVFGGPHGAAIVIQTNGNVAMDTTDTTARLAIGGNGRTILVHPTVAGQSSFLEFNNANGSVRGIIGVDGNGYSGAANQFSIASWTAHPMKFFTAGAERMMIAPGGNVGIGTTTPSRMLEVGGSTGKEGLMRLYSVSANGAARFFDVGVPISDTSTSGRFFSFVIDDPSTGPDAEFLIRWDTGFVGIGKTNPATRLDVGGEITCTALNVTSDRDAKEQFSRVDTRAVLDKVTRLPISEWQYKTETGPRHIGPMAQDFHQAFGFGRDDKHITSVDADGVALAAIQGLNEKLEEQGRDKDARIRELEKTVEQLKELVGHLASEKVTR